MNILRRSPHFAPFAPFAFALLVVVVAYYHVFFLGYWAVNDSDALKMHLPRNEFLAQMFARGSLPFWSPYENLGQVVPNGFAFLFHPGLVWYLLFPPLVANSVEILLGLFLMALGTWYLLRQFGAGVLATAIASTCYVLAGPVFFLHTYHLSHPPITLLPWCLLAFHRHDRTGERKWLFVSAVLLIAIAQSSDPDAALYVWIALAFDRLVSMPRAGRHRFAALWGAVLFLTGVTAAVYALPLYQALELSSRMSKSNILDPLPLDLLAALFTTQWATPYENFYFYLGPGFLWLLVSGLSTFRRGDRAYRYFFLVAPLPLLYAAARIAQSVQPTFLATFDLWRFMFVFCFGSAMVIVHGVRNLSEQTVRQRRVNLVFGLVNIGIASLLLVVGRREFATTAPFIIGFVQLSLSVPRRLPWLWGTVLLVTAFSFWPPVNVFIRDTHPLVRDLHPRQYRWRQPASAQLTEKKFFEFTRFHSTKALERSIRGYASLREVEGVQRDNARIALLGPDSYPSLAAGLRVLPIHNVVHHRGFQERLEKDGLVDRDPRLDLWMQLSHPDARKLALYGVRFLVEISDERIRQQDRSGWRARPDISWLEHRVWENLQYKGRAYFLSTAEPEKAAAEIEFLEDAPMSVLLRVKASQPGQLVLADLRYPGWDVWVDGKKSGDVTFHDCLRAVNLPAGEHVVKWGYRGTVQKAGLGVGAGAVLLLVVLVLAVRPRKPVMDHEHA